jgi:hypothetical protein
VAPRVPQHRRCWIRFFCVFWWVPGEIGIVAESETVEEAEVDWYPFEALIGEKKEQG